MKFLREYTISTHAPAGGATPVSHTEGEAIALFLLTPLREGRLELDVLALCLVDFYSRPCGRGDLVERQTKRFTYCISTHAPAGGATELFHVAVPAECISTHAPAGGATGGGIIALHVEAISTHAPAGGATDRF